MTGVWNSRAPQTLTPRVPMGLVAAALTLTSTTVGPPVATEVFEWVGSGALTIDAGVSGLFVGVMLLAAALAITVAIGGPIWLLLRALRRETVQDYALAGGMAGLVAIPTIALLASIPFGRWLLVIGPWGGAAGALAALVFWAVARDP